MYALLKLDFFGLADSPHELSGRPGNGSFNLKAELNLFANGQSYRDTIQCAKACSLCLGPTFQHDLALRLPTTLVFCDSERGERALEHQCRSLWLLMPGSNFVYPRYVPSVIFFQPSVCPPHTEHSPSSPIHQHHSAMLHHRELGEPCI